jgi:hypothetical protein
VQVKGAEAYMECVYGAAAEWVLLELLMGKRAEVTAKLNS